MRQLRPRNVGLLLDTPRVLFKFEGPFWGRSKQPASQGQWEESGILFMIVLLLHTITLCRRFGRFV